MAGGWVSGSNTGTMANPFADGQQDQPLPQGATIETSGDTPLPKGAVVQGQPQTGQDTALPPGAIIEGQPQTAAPVEKKAPGAPTIEHSASLMQRARSFLLGSEPNQEQPYGQPGYLSAFADEAKQDLQAVQDWRTAGPTWKTVGQSLAHQIPAQAESAVGGAQEYMGTEMQAPHERMVAALNVLPQVAARTPGDTAAQIAAMAKDPLVAKTARAIGTDPKVLASEWATISRMTPDQQATVMHIESQKLAATQRYQASGQQKRWDAQATQQAWTPADTTGNLTEHPWSLKGLAFNTAKGGADMLISMGAAAAGGAVAGPAGAAAAGGLSMAALTAPQAYSDAQNHIDERLDQLHAAVQAAARGKDPQAAQALAAQANDLAAGRERTAGTYALLTGLAQGVGTLPLVDVLAKTPGSQLIMNRLVGSTLAKTVGGRITQAAIANGIGGTIQSALQKGIDTGVLNEHSSLSDALHDIAYTGLTSAVTGAVLGGAHEAYSAPGRANEAAQAQMRDWQQGMRGFTPPPEPTAAPAQPTLQPGGGGAAGGTPAPVPEAASAPADRQQAHADKITALNAAAAQAEKRSDVTLQPEEDGWSVHVNGQPVAQFDTRANAEAAMAQARKVVGTGVSQKSQVSQSQAVPETKPPVSETQPPAGETIPAKTETPATNPETERRSDVATRQKVSQMSPDEMRQALLTHELTGIPNRRAYDESPKKPTQVAVDLDSLKAINDMGSHQAGDQIIKAVAQALHEESGGNAYHVGGDEFIVQADNRDHAEDTMLAVQNRLAGARIDVQMPDGRVMKLKGIGVSYGHGDTLEKADAELQQSKHWREQLGERAPRGELPAGATVEPAETGRQSGGRTSSAQVLGQEVTHTEPTAAQAEAGNYRHPTVEYGPLTLAVENLPGSTRRYTNPDGSTSERVMKDAYGYVRGKNGADGEGLDVFMGHNPDASHVYVIDQKKPDGKFDEHKAMVGYDSEAEAKAAYARNYQKGWKGLSAITPMDPAAFKHWIDHGDLTKPLAPAAKYAQIGDLLHRHALQAGWAEIGGRLRRTETGSSESGLNEKVGRSKWIPHEPWFAQVQRAAELPHNKNGEATRTAIRKAVRGEKLTAAEQRHVDAIYEIASMKHYTSEELRELPADKFWEYDQAIKELYGESAQMHAGEPTSKYGEQPDLFGNRSDIKNHIAKVEAERARRERNAPAPREVEGDDLFNGSQKQTDLVREPQLSKDTQELLASYGADTPEVKAIAARMEERGLRGEGLIHAIRESDEYRNVKAQRVIANARKAGSHAAASLLTSLHEAGASISFERSASLGSISSYVTASHDGKSVKIRLSDHEAPASALPSDIDIKPQQWKKAEAQVLDRLGLAGAMREPTATDAFHQWSKGAPLIRAKDAGTHDFKTGSPVVVEAFHGTARPDRIGNQFRKSRATSGPMAFFTSDPEIAGNYANNKSDTSLAYEDQNYENWFKYKPPGQRTAVSIDRAWHILTPEQRAKIASLAPRIRHYDANGDEMEHVAVGPEGHKTGAGAYDQHIKEARGNHLKALVEEWLNSGNLIRREEEFLHVLKIAGFPVEHVEMDSPHATYPATYPVYVRMSKPLVTTDIPAEVRSALDRAASLDRTRPAPGGADLWDKNTRTLREFVQELNGREPEHAWTSIPDKVTRLFKSFGYDGIVDDGGKYADTKHKVYIPFEPNQVKSSVGNRGTFDESSNITREPGANAYRNTQMALNFGSGPEVVKPSFEARPDTIPADVKRGLAAVRSLLFPRDMGSGATVLGDAIPKEFVYTGHAALIGRTAEHPVVLGQIAQVYRNPLFETLHVMYTKGDQIVFETAVSSRLSGAASFVERGKSFDEQLQSMRDIMKRTGADGYYLLHNHPSGRSEPSRADVKMTRTVDHYVPGFRAHVVVNHRTFHVIDSRTRSEDDAQGYRIPEHQWMVGQNARKPHALLGTTVKDPRTLAIAAKQVQAQAQKHVVIMSVTGNTYEQTVRSVTSWPPELLTDDKMKALARLRRLSSQSGGGHVFAVVPDDFDVKKIDGMFLDVVRASQPERSLVAAREYNTSVPEHVWNGGRGEAAGSVAVFDRAAKEPEPLWFSGLTRAVESAKREKGTANEWLGTIQNMPGVKADELDYTGLKDWLDGRGRVGKQEVLDYLKAHEIQVGETFNGARDEPSADGLAARKAIFDRYQPQIDAAQREAEEAQKGLNAAIYRKKGSISDARKLSDAALENVNSLRETRDREADAAYVVPSSTETEFSQYVLPGGKNYREMLLTLPERDTGNYTSPHWETKNVLAHVRFDERTDADGRKVLHIAEVQSDWHQHGRRHGYKTADMPDTNRLREVFRTEEQKALYIVREHDNFGFDNARTALQYFDAHNDWKERWEVDTKTAAELQPYMDAYKNLLAAMEVTARTNDAGKLVPDAPFKTTWPELAMKRMIRWAADHGFDRITWDTGETNTNRYDLSKQVASVMYSTDNELRAFDPDGNTVISEPDVMPEALPDYIGKDAADRLLATTENNGWHMIEGENLKSGGEGMHAFYDKMLPSIVGKLTKKWGGKVRMNQLVPAEGETEDVMNGEFGAEEGESPPGIAVHSLDITPEMREAALGGMAVFDRGATYNAGGEEPPETPGHPGPDSPAARENAELAKDKLAKLPPHGLLHDLKHLLAPANVDEFSREAARDTRAALGALAQDSEQTLHRLDEYSRQFDLLSPKDRISFINAIERGEAQSDVRLQPAADAIRSMLDEWREKIRGLGIGALDNYIENYFPHIWAQPDAARRLFSKMVGRRPLKGSQSFLKERTIPFFQDGLDAGLKPLTTNPLTLTFLKLREMQQFHMGVQLMQHFRETGLAKFLPSGKMMPPGWAEIKDAVGRVRQWSEAEKGFIERGRYVMPEHAAQIINNHLSGSHLRNVTAAQSLRVMSNTLNALQLGFSAFHLGFTTLDAIISKNALAIERLIRGEPIGAMRAFLEAATGPGAAVANLMRGHALLKAYLDPTGATPQLQMIVQALRAAGGAVKMDNYYQAAQGLSPFKGVGIRSFAQDMRAAMTQPQHKLEAMAKTMGSFVPDYSLRVWRDLQAMTKEMPKWQVPVEIAGRMTRAGTALIMEHIVPLQKLGVFSDMMHDWLGRNSDAPMSALQEASQKAWDSVDNRLGEMVYNNLFWHRTFKDATHLSVRAVGWNVGTIREIGGAPVDAAKLASWLAHGMPEPEQPRLSREATDEERAEANRQWQDWRAAKDTWNKIADQVGHRIPYVIAMTVTGAMVGAITQTLFTGTPPWQTDTPMKDYFFPRTGRLTKYGTPERISLPAYIKDVLEYAESPLNTAMNKLNPAFGIVHSIISNEDFYGNAIRDPDAPLWKQMVESAEYGLKEAMPFSLQGMKQFAGAGEPGWRGTALKAMPFIGLSPAPARVTSPEQMDRYQMQQDENSYIKHLTQLLRQARAQKRNADAERLENEIREHRQASRKNKRDIRQVQHTSRIVGQAVTGKSRAAGAAALEAAGLPAFARLWAAMGETLRPRVAESLKSFA